MLKKLALTYAELDDYPYYLLSDNAFQWIPCLLQNEMDQNRKLFPEMTDDEYYGQTLILDITGLTEEGKELWRYGALVEIGQSDSFGHLPHDLNINDIDLEPWNDPGTDPDYYLTGTGDPVADGREYIMRHYYEK